MGNALFVVWRESVEAILVVGILYAWIRRGSVSGVGLRHLFLGSGAGVLLAATLGALMLGLQSQLAGQALDAFQIGVLFVAAALIAQMVAWMNAHGRHIRRDLEISMMRAAERSGGWSCALLAALAVGREGAETVLFLYGIAAERQGGELLDMVLGSLLGFLLALATRALLVRGSRWVPARLFFGVSSALLLLLAGALVVTGVERLVGLDWVPTLGDPLFDISALLDDTSTPGGAVSALTGYRARPSGLVVLAFLVYWALAFWWLRHAAKGAGK